MSPEARLRERTEPSLWLLLHAHAKVRAAPWTEGQAVGGPGAAGWNSVGGTGVTLSHHAVGPGTRRHHHG